MTVDAEPLNAWRGRSETADDIVTVAPMRMLRAALDLPTEMDVTKLPALWHWLYFLPSARQSELGEDGHPRRGGFLPPVPLPRRMWAGGGLGHAPIHGAQRHQLCFSSSETRVRSFCFRACGQPSGSNAIDLWIHDHQGHEDMTARMEFAP